MRLMALALCLTLPTTALAQDCAALAGLPGIVEPSAYAIRDPASAVAACADPTDARGLLWLARARLALDPRDRSVVALLSQAVSDEPALTAAALGQLYERGQAGLPASDEQARALYDAACRHWPDPDAAPGCTALSVMRLEGRGGPEEAGNGFRMLRNLCDTGWGPACTELAFQTELRGDGDPAPVAALFAQGCAAGDLLACSQYGFRLELGEGVSRDVAQARDLYQRACLGGEPQGCSNLGEVYRSGLGVRPDMTEALRLFDLGCAGHDPYACVTLGDILADGRGAPRDVPRALVAFDAACVLGDPEACDRADALR